MYFWGRMSWDAWVAYVMLVWIRVVLYVVPTLKVSTGCVNIAKQKLIDKQILVGHGIKLITSIG